MGKARLPVIIYKGAQYCAHRLCSYLCTLDRVQIVLKCVHTGDSPAWLPFSRNHTAFLYFRYDSTPSIHSASCLYALSAYSFHFRPGWTLCRHFSCRPRGGDRPAGAGKSPPTIFYFQCPSHSFHPVNIGVKIHLSSPLKNRLTVRKTGKKSVHFPYVFRPYIGLYLCYSLK